MIKIDIKKNMIKICCMKNCELKNFYFRMCFMYLLANVHVYACSA